MDNIKTRSSFLRQNLCYIISYMSKWSVFAKVIYFFLEINYLKIFINSWLEHLFKESCKSSYNTCEFLKHKCRNNKTFSFLLTHRMIRFFLLSFIHSKIIKVKSLIWFLSCYTCFTWTSNNSVEINDYKYLFSMSIFTSDRTLRSHFCMYKIHFL